MLKYLNKIGFFIAMSAIFANTAHAVNTNSMMPLGGNPEAYMDDIGDTVNEEAEVDLPPEANLKVRNDSGNIDMYSGTTATTFTFYGTSSKDAETPNYLLEVRFDFENDGKLDTYYSQQKEAGYKYKKPGIKTVRMDVLDKAGHVSSAYKQITVVENTKPRAHFTVEPSIGTPGTLFTFDSSASNDDQYNKDLLTHRYDYDGDGTWDTKLSKITTGKHKFDTPGLKNVKLQVLDPEGASDTYTYTVYIKPNTPPVADFVVTENEDGRVVVDAENSFDKNTDKLEYRWDFNYNGKNDIQYDTPWIGSGLASHVYKKPGEYLIKLMVKDPDSAIAVRIMRIFVDILR